MTATFEVVNAKHLDLPQPQPLDKFYFSGAHTWSTLEDINMCGRHARSLKVDKNFQKMLYPGGEDKMPPFPPDKNEINGKMLTDTDTWHMHWDDGDRRPTAQSTSTGYQ